VLAFAFSCTGGEICCKNVNRKNVLKITCRAVKKYSCQNVWMHTLVWMAYQLTPPVPQTKSIQSWEWSVMNYGGFGRKSEFTAPKAQSIPSHFRALGWTNGSVIPLQTWTGLRAPASWGSQISRQSAYKGGNFVSPTYRPPLPSHDIFLVNIFVRGWIYFG